MAKQCCSILLKVDGDLGLAGLPETWIAQDQLYGTIILLLLLFILSCLFKF